ncbi:MAG: hypothetical protein EB018_00410 [Gammaproteobacteria bacterium]|nr:hypothetical protein [Gammaproteobacteria bacterium]
MVLESCEWPRAAICAALGTAVFSPSHTTLIEPSGPIATSGLCAALSGGLTVTMCPVATLDSAARLAGVPQTPSSAIKTRRSMF